MLNDSIRYWLIFPLACMLFVLSQFYRVSVAVITLDLVRDLAIDTSGLSLISAAFFYAFALMQIPISLVLDGIGARISMTALSLVAAIGALLFAMGESLVVLVTGRILMGIGMACNLVGTLKLITLWYNPFRFGTLSALVFSLGTLGNLVAATPLVLMVQAVGWRNAFLIIAGINFLITMAFYLVVRDRPSQSRFPEISGAKRLQFAQMWINLLRLFRKRDYWIISLGTFCRYGIFAAVQSLWAAPFLIHVMGISVVSTGNLLLIMSIGTVIGSPVCGWLSDAVLKNRKRIIIAGLLAMGICLVLVSSLRANTSMPVLGALFFGFGFFNGAGGIMYAHIKERMPIEQAGTAMTGINFFTMFGVAVFLQGLGSMMEALHPGDSLGNGAFTDAFWFCAICLGLTAGLYLFTRETRSGQDRKPDPSDQGNGYLRRIPRPVDDFQDKCSWRSRRHRRE
jgi:sugar phosphate permease